MAASLASIAVAAASPDPPSSHPEMQACAGLIAEIAKIDIGIDAADTIARAGDGCGHRLLSL